MPAEDGRSSRGTVNKKGTDQKLIIVISGKT